MTYFDSAGSYPMLPEARASLTEALSLLPGNPSALHGAGLEAADAVSRCRAALADAIGAMPSEIIFTSGATESNNLALKGHYSQRANEKRRHLIISATEHKCIFAIADYLSRTQNVDVSIAKPSKDGTVQAEDIEQLLRPETSLVSVMHVNNEIGTINPLQEIGKLCSSRKVAFHSDAAQGFLKDTLDVDDYNLDYLSISAHKIGGPKGIGAVYIRDQRNREIEPTIHGAGQEDGLRGGTLPAPLIHAFGSAIAHFPTAYAALCKMALTDVLMSTLSENNVEFIVNGTPRSHLISLTLPKTDVASLLRIEDRRFSIATGSACSSKEIEISHVLEVIGLNRELADKTLRISFSHLVKPSDAVDLGQMIHQYESA